ncbi:MAG: hypothetical protein ABIO85_09145 [Sphingomicrobium sp.]
MVGKMIEWNSPTMIGAHIPALHIGQRAELKVSAIHDRTLPIINDRGGASSVARRAIFRNSIHESSSAKYFSRTAALQKPCPPLSCKYGSFTG